MTQGNSEMMTDGEALEDVGTDKRTATGLLGSALFEMEKRAVDYDAPQGERSIARTVAMFNAATDHKLSESDGWLFMVFLKIVRDRSVEGGHKDSCVDMTAYSALYGESRLRGD